MIHQTHLNLLFFWNIGEKRRESSATWQMNVEPGTFACDSRMITVILPGNTHYKYIVFSPQTWILFSDQAITSELQILLALYLIFVSIFLEQTLKQRHPSLGV